MPSPYRAGKQARHKHVTRTPERPYKTGVRLPAPPPSTPGPAVFRVNIIMAYDAETLVVLHGLTSVGEERYRQFLEDEGTRILFRAQHPVRYYAELAVDALKLLFRR